MIRIPILAESCDSAPFTHVAVAFIEIQSDNERVDRSQNDTKYFRVPCSQVLLIHTLNPCRMLPVQQTINGPKYCLMAFKLLVTDYRFWRMNTVKTSFRIRKK